MDEHDHDGSEDRLHAVMGPQEASVIGVALGMLLSKVNADIDAHEEHDEESQDEFLAMLSVKLCAENMFVSLWSMLGMSDEEVAALIYATEGRGEEE